jgi:hypothetical protein
MPTVPSLESPQVEAEALPGRAFPRVDDTVNPAAFGTPVAQGLDEIAHAATTEQAKEKIQNDNLRVIDANTQLEAGRNALLYGSPDKDGNLQGGAFSMRGLDAINMPAKLIPQYQAMASGISQTLTPDQQRIFTNHIAQGQNELNLQLNRYEFEEHNRMANTIYGNASKQAIESASIGYADPAVVGKSRADIKALVAMQGQREGWDQSTKDEQTQKLLAEMHYSVVDRMLADGQPETALQYFVGTKDEPGIRDSNELTGQESHQLGATIDAALREKSAQNQSAVTAKVRDVRAAAVNGQLIPPSSMPSDDELKSAYPTSWQEVRGAINRDVQMGSDLKTMAVMSPEQIAETVGGYKPDAVTGAAEQYERYNAVQTAANTIMARRAQDPRQYAIDNHLGSNPLDFKDPAAVGAELRDRASTAGVLSNHLGGAVPLLSKGEAASLSQTLESQKPDQRLGTLYSLATSIGDDRAFQAVMHQVLPGSPTTAIVGNQVVASNPQSAPVWFDRNFASDPTSQAKILQGETLLHPQADEKGEKKEVFPMPPDGGTSGLRQQFAEKVGDLFRTRPELSESYYQAFKDAYASLLSDKGDVSGNGSTKLRDQALSMALGHLSRFNGQNVSIPQGMDPSRFEGLVNNAVVAKAKSLGAPEGFESKIGGYTLQEQGDLGSGQYRLLNGTLPLVRPDGKGPFEIDLKQDYQPDRAHGSPEDKTRAAAATAAPAPQGGDLEGGTRLQKPAGGAGRAIAAPAIKAPTGGKGAAGRPSQAPAL